MMQVALEEQKMTVKRFVAADMRRALELVRQELGPEAIILSSRRVKQGVEIVTSLQESAANVTSSIDHAIDGVDVPMGSDGAWRDQKDAETTFANSPALRSARLATQGSQIPFPTSTFKTDEREHHAAHSRGPASGKTAQELALELDAARERMLAAKRQQSYDDKPIGQMSDAEFDQYSAAKPQPGATWRQESNATHKSSNSSQFDQRQPSYSHTKFAHHDSESASDHAGSRFDDHAASAQHHNYREQAAERQQFVERMSLNREHDVQQHAEHQRQMDSLQSELADMRLLLEEQLTRMANTPQLSSPIQSGVMRRLKHMGLTDRVANAVIELMNPHRTVQEAWADALAILSRQIPTADEDRVMKGGMFAFVGPTGVGKTTTIAKLAARAVLEHGAANVAMVTTDTYRIAAHDQLRSLGRILNVQVKVVDDNQDLQAVLRSLKHCPLVLIDTAGFRLGDPQLKAQLQALHELENVSTFLVMAANAQLQMMKATIHAHQGVGLHGCVLTKLDESASLGESISLLVEQQLPIVYTTDGQEIPQDLAVAKGHRLVAKSVGLMRAGLHSSGDVQSSGQILS